MKHSTEPLVIFELNKYVSNREVLKDLAVEFTRFLTNVQRKELNFLWIYILHIQTYIYIYIYSKIFIYIKLAYIYKLIDIASVEYFVELVVLENFVELVCLLISFRKVSPMFVSTF